MFFQELFEKKTSFDRPKNINDFIIGFEIEFVIADKQLYPFLSHVYDLGFLHLQSEEKYWEERSEEKYKEFIKAREKFKERYKNIFKLISSKTGLKIRYDFFGNSNRIEENELVVSEEPGITSINHDNKEILFGFEIKTPPIIASRAIHLLFEILDILDNIDQVRFTEYSGLHTNISFKNPEKNKKIDKILSSILNNLLFLFDMFDFDIYHRYSDVGIDLYGKVKNYFKNTHLSRMTLEAFSRNLTKFVDEMKKFLNMENMVEKYKKQIPVIVRDSENQYIEFRIIGGKDYNKKDLEILKNIYFFLSSMDNYTKFLTENIKQTIKKLYKIIDYGSKKKEIKYPEKRYDRKNILRTMIAKQFPDMETSLIDKLVNKIFEITDSITTDMIMKQVNEKNPENDFIKLFKPYLQRISNWKFFKTEDEREKFLNLIMAFFISHFQNFYGVKIENLKKINIKNILLKYEHRK